MIYISIFYIIVRSRCPGRFPVRPLVRYFVRPGGSTMNCQVKCSSSWDLVQTNLAVFGNVKSSWAWRWSTPGFFERCRAHPWKVPALGIKFPQNPVQILIRSFLPCTIQIRKVHITVQGFLYLPPTGKLAASVARWSSWPLLWDTWKGCLWSLSPSFLPSCPVS